MHFVHFRARLTRVALLAFALHYLPLHTSAQRPPAQPNAAEILHKMQKLNVLGSVLYIVAHPDDENTKLIAWLANGKKVRTGNLSLTRGDGGQNLIGPELGDALGIIRTQELMEARRIDGGEQFFTRAVDFGYSKSADESFEKWGKQEVLSDVVRVIRMFRPDIIITRFSTEPGGTHGHHTASAILAHEAFDLAGDPKAFPEQLEEGLEVWQPRRLFHNGSTWWRKDLADIVKTDPDWFSVDVGGYDQLLGLSYTEIAGRSRSMHKSQGFGAAETRGEQLEYLHFEKGDRPQGDDIFEGIDMTWGRLSTGKAANEQTERLVSEYAVNAPERSIVCLAGIHDILSNHDKSTDPQSWISKKLDEVEDLILACAGLSIEALSDIPWVKQDDSISVELKITLRRTAPITIRDFKFLGEETVWSEDSMITNQAYSKKVKGKANRIVDQPYWLAEPHGAIYSIKDPSLIGKPTDQQSLIVFVTLNVAEISWFGLTLPVTTKWVDRVMGERLQLCRITPAVSIEPATNIVLARTKDEIVAIDIRAITNAETGGIVSRIVDNDGHSKIGPLGPILAALPAGEVKSFQLSLSNSTNDGIEVAELAFTGPDHYGQGDRTLHEIDYPHIMAQVYYTPAEVKLIPLDVKVNATRVGYIKGAGDDVPQAIERLGVTVDMIDPSTATLESISKYDAIVVGIRAYNTEKAMAQFNPVLMKFVENGGTVVAQYNTQSRDMFLPDSLIGPYPFKLTRDRVTVEEATPTFLDPKHPLLNTPNKITLTDFDGWVQERGLYFVGERDPKYTALISWNDPGEDQLDGALITCDHGKGRYIYTGISFFRELPAGVPGAYRLWANLISKRE